MPFKWKELKEDTIISCIKKAIIGIEKFDVECTDFGAFPPKAIFVNIEDNPRLIELQKAISTAMKQELNQIPRNDARPYHPHITVAYRDLKKNEFDSAWKEFEGKRFDQKFSAKSVWLLKHNGKSWDAYKEILF